jgi:SET domain-containing protein
MDLINHSSAPNCYYETGLQQNHPKLFTFSDMETGDFVLRADRELLPNEELFITYGGSKSDHVLLAFYGFCLPPGVNRNSYIVFSPNFIAMSSHSENRVNLGPQKTLFKKKKDLESKDF